jgi:hypothetical protein
MDNKQFVKSALDQILESLNTNNELLQRYNAQNELIIEQLNTIHQRSEDTSRKMDEVFNIGIKKPKVVVHNTESVVGESRTTSTPPKQPRKKPAPKNVAHSEAKSSESETPVKTINNIMTYFKTRYLEDPSVFDDILEENQAESLFAEYADEISSKKEGIQRNKAKISILYKKMTKEQKKKIREKMMDENEAASVNNDEDVAEECNSD